jgi:hypothetical protein
MNKKESPNRHLIVTLPPDFIKRIDEESQARDMTRSRYVLRLLEKAYGLEWNTK